MTVPARAVPLPAPLRGYDHENEAQLRRLLELRLKEMSARIDLLGTTTDESAATLYLELDGGTVGVSYGDYTDGGSLASRPAITYDAGVID